MGLDVSANIIVGAPYDEIYKEGRAIYEVAKIDKNGVKYTIEESFPVFTFLGKTYREDDDVDFYDLLEEKGLVEINEEIIGIEIVSTESHRNYDYPVSLSLSDLNKKIESAMKKMESLGIKGNIYLVNEIY